jgi:hypothetical protein
VIASLWDWQRLWIPASAQSALARATLLPDDIEQINPRFQTLSQLANRRLLILLGEPGIGKTTELRRAKDAQLGETASHQVLWLDGTAIGSDYQLDREWFESTLFKNWLVGDYSLWIFFDGFDQSRAHVPGLGRIIENRLATAPLERLHLRISSRTAEWDFPLGDNIASQFYGPDDPGLDTSPSFVLAPPKRSDIVSALSSEGLDTAKFMEQLDQVQIGPVALRPIGLKWLMSIFRRRGQFPESADELYWEGMRILSQELADQWSNRDGSALSAENVRQIAARIAFVTAFSNRDSVWTGLIGGGSDSSVVVSDLVGGAENPHGTSTPVTESMLRESLQRGIFSGLAADSVGWAHQTFREFLAARFCVERSLSTEQILGLLTNPSDHEGKIIPNLREVAAWLASMRADVLEQLIDRDPQTLFDSDVALTGPEQRERLLKALVEGIESGSVIITRWHAKDEFRKLSFPRMEEPLRQYLSDGSLRDQARKTVIDVIRDCQLHALAEQLATIALNSSEPELVRVNATWGVRDLDCPKAHEMIKPLIHAAETESSLAPESIDDLRGNALAATWRDHLSIEELLSVLTAPCWDGFGGYKLFLNRFIEKLQVGELSQAFAWLESQDWGEQHWELESIERELLEKAWSNLDHTEALECFAGWVVRHLSRSTTIFGDRVSPDIVRERIGDQTRRRLALDAVLPSLDVTQVGAELARTIRFTGLASLILPEDFRWLLDQIRRSTGNEVAQERWVRAAFQAYDPEKVELTQLLWNLDEEGIGGPLLNSAFDAVDLDSEEADQERLRWEAFYSTKDPDSEEDGEPFSAVSKVALFLEDIAAGKSDIWWHLDFRLQVDESGMHHGGTDEWEADICVFPGWSRCDESLRTKIVVGADQYLRSNQPHPDWFGTLAYNRPDLAGFRALVLLQEEAPHLFDALPDSVWHTWGPLILAFPPKSSSDEIPYQRRLLSSAVHRGFKAMGTLQLIAEQEEDTSTYIFSSALRATCDVLDDDARHEIASEFINPKWSPAIMQEASRVLIEMHDDVAATRLAVQVAKDMVTNSASRLAGADIAGRVLMSKATKYWDELWPLITESEDVRHAIYHVISWQDRHDSQLSANLDERQLADLYLALAREFPPEEDPKIQGVHAVGFREDLGWWRESILTHLAQRGTWAAANELARLSAELPSISWIRVRAAQARDLARSATWAPPTPEDLMEIVRSPNRRIVDSTDQLHEVLLDSLAALQEELHAETPAAAYYWNHPNNPEASPKDEQEVSNYIKKYLDQHLVNSGIIINREVQNRRGNETDLYVQAIRADDQSSVDIITVVCEVKGCWNGELYTAQEKQLLNRYVVQNGHTHGIYIVAYFDGDRWNSVNRKGRHSKCRNHTLDELRNELSVQSQRLSSDQHIVQSVVLDMNF